ncbi:hypothetical protein [Absidia glauca]|uniref:SWIM-type domain-containing protein n=1 Tax=Absidia glauca TaxID=4829 RepID=A0A168R6Z5_ABSGL|nr:hypothetical protein [Absidia glauca]
MSTSLTSFQALRIRPEYTTEVVDIEFASNDAYEDCFTNVASKHAIFRYHGKHTPKAGSAGHPQLTIYCTTFAITLAFQKRRRMTPLKRNEEKQRSHGKIEVVYNWVHANHDPFDIEDIAHSRLPLELRNWIVDCVDRHMNFKSIKSLLRLNIDQLDELEGSISGGRFPPALIIKQQDVVNIINEKLNKISRRHPVDRISVNKWLEYLQSKNHHTFFFDQENGPFVVGWYSQWQKELLEGALDWCVDSTHHTCKSMKDPDQYCYLYTIMVRSPFTNKGVPVAFMLTSSEVIPNLVKWFNDLKINNNLNVQRIMINCSTTEIAAIRQVFDGVSILLCHWHIKRAWDGHIKRDVKGADKYQTKAIRDGVRLSIDAMMNTSSAHEFEVSWTAFNDKKELWSKAFRQDAPFHTNNLIESYHNQLKTLYLGRKRQNRMDRTIYILSQVMIADYRLEAAQVFYKVKAFNLTKNEKMAKNRAEEIDDNVAYMMIAKIMSSTGFIVSCSCPVITGLCKHMFLVSKIKVIPYYSNTSTSSASLPSPSTPIASASAPSVSPLSAPLDMSLHQSATTTDRRLNNMEFEDKMSIMEWQLVQSLHGAKRRSLGDDLLMDELCDKVKTSLNIFDGIGNRSLYSSRQS